MSARVPLVPRRHPHVLCNANEGSWGQGAPAQLPSKQQPSRPESHKAATSDRKATNSAAEHEGAAASGKPGAKRAADRRRGEQQPAELQGFRRRQGDGGWFTEDGFQNVDRRDAAGGSGSRSARFGRDGGGQDLSGAGRQRQRRLSLIHI